MRTHGSLALPCRQCGKQVSFSEREVKRNANLIATCPHCGFVDLAMNIVGHAVYNRLKKLGHGDLKPFTPEPIDPVIVIPGKNGFETVIRRPKKGGARLYTRKIKSPRKTAPNG